jgi:hypothetical protein
MNRYELRELIAYTLREQRVPTRLMANRYYQMYTSSMVT